MALIRTCLLALIVLAPAIAQGRERCAAVVGSAAGGDVSVDVLIPWPHLPWGRHTAVSWRPRAIGWGITLDLFYPHGSLQGFGAPTGARISLANPEVMPADFRFVIAVGKQTWSVPGERSNDTPFSAKQDFLEQAVIDSRSQPYLLRSLGRASTLYVIAIWDGPLARATTTFSLDKAAVKARDDLLAEVRGRIRRNSAADCSLRYDQGAPATQYLCGDSYSDNCPTMPGRGRVLTLRP